MVGHIPLEDVILVRVQVSQLWLEIIIKNRLTSPTMAE